MRQMGWHPPGARIEWYTPVKRFFIHMNAILALMVVVAIHNGPIVSCVAALHDGRGLRATPSNEGCPGSHDTSSWHADVATSPRCARMRLPGISLAMCPSTTCGAYAVTMYTKMAWL
jgi:hypothetical protein